jgi:gamma-glutamylcyclotransferase (GGCT)/AIG2-like uncharacterized protein YtfP
MPMTDHRLNHVKAPPNDAPMIRRERRAYFAYGANMSTAAMKARCPTASFVCAALLQGQFRINGYGVATVALDRSATVHGVLWTVTASDEAALDIFEGVEAGFYQQRLVEVLTSCRQRVRAFAYISAETRPGSPRQGYLAEIIEAAHVHGFPPDYIRELVGWLV